MQKWRIYLYAMIILFGGILSGASGLRFYQRYQRENTTRRSFREGEHHRSPPENTPVEVLTHRLAQRYHLNATQIAELTTALTEFLAKNKQTRQQLQNHRETLEAKLQTILSAEDFADWQKRRDRQRPPRNGKSE